MDVKDINLNEYEVDACLDNGNIVLRKKKSKYPKWEDLGEIRGYHIYPDSSIGALTEATVQVGATEIYFSPKSTLNRPWLWLRFHN